MEALMCLQNWVIRGMKATKLESAYAIATIFDDSDSEGGATSEIIDPESECDFGFEERWELDEVGFKLIDIMFL